MQVQVKTHFNKTETTATVKPLTQTKEKGDK